MSTLPLEVHEVLEEEYVSMYGAAPADYDAFEIKDATGARRILTERGIAADDIQGALKQFVDGSLDIRLLATNQVLDDSANARAARRHIVDAAFGKTIAPVSSAAVDYAAFEILDEKWACSILRACEIDAAGGAAATLAKIVNDAQKPAALEKSPVLNDTARMLLAGWSDYAKDGDRRKLNRRIVDETLCGAIKPYRDMELERIYAALHDRPEGEARTALCISGGGIRSATFALGVIQGLAGANVLDKFDYLSTVSGGGYIGSWLSSWSRRNARGITGVQDELVRADTAVDGSATLGNDGKERIREPKADVPESKIDPEPRPVRHLREYSNYLSPRLGLASADSWTIAALYIRNLLLNLLVLVPILAALLAFPRLFAWMMRVVGYSEGYHYVHAWQLLAAPVVFIAIAFFYLGSTRPVEHGRKAEAKVFFLFRRWRANTRFLIGCVLPLTLAAISLALFWDRSYTNPNLLGTPWFWWYSGAGLAVMMIAPFASYYYRTVKSSAAERQDPLGRDSAKALWRKFVYELLGALTGVGTTVALLVLLATKVFPDPLKKIVDPKDILPMLRTITDTAPVSTIYLCLAVPLILVVFYVQASVFVGISSTVNEEYDREWWGRAGAWLLMIAGLLAGASLISVFGPVFLYRAPVILGSLGGVSGIIAGFVGFSAKTSGGSKDGQKSSSATMASGISNALLVPLFAVILLAAISLGTTWVMQQFHDPLPPAADAWDAQFESASAEKTPIQIDGRKFEVTTSVAKAPLVSVADSLGVAHMRTIQRDTEWPDLILLIDVALLAYLLSHCIGVNRFSMHAFYRNRIIRAYLGASRYSRDPDAFTGFDANDNLQMYELRSELLWPSHLADPKAFIDLLVERKERHDSRAPDDSVYNKIWYHLDRVTRSKIEEGNDRSAAMLDSVVQHINAIIACRNETIAGTNVPSEKRAVIDEAFKGLVPERNRSLLHVVNTALNLTAGEKLAWQQRKAESFTVSALHSGSAYVGYRDSREYGGDDGISLGGAVTISGAAASPNQGYNSSPPLAFLLAMLNVRLGCWLGNPGLAGKDSYRVGHPNSNLKAMFGELLGSTTDTYDWIYLSDGGHFENLALYEMVLRRCRYIVVSDGGCDPTFTFEDLGNAIRKIRTDLGVPIDLVKKVEMFPRAKPGLPLGTGTYMAKAIIRYSSIDAGGVDGTLVYLKPSVYQDDFLPRDVYNYAQQSETFPHETTADQFFSESQFESYRALGRYVINVISGNFDGVSTTKAPYALKFRNVADFVSKVPLAGKSGPQVGQMEITTTEGDLQIARAVGDGVKIRIRPPA